jgi:hypothetical protein
VVRIGSQQGFVAALSLLIKVCHPHVLAMNQLGKTDFEVAGEELGKSELLP